MEIKASQEILDLLQLIDDKYLDAKRRSISRLSIEWGTWSRTMNVDIRGKLEEPDYPHKLGLKHIFIYWINRSELLELHHQTKVGKARKKKQLLKAGTDLRKRILRNEFTTGDEGETWSETIMSALFRKK